MIRRHMCIEREVVEQHTLFDLPWSHHRISSCLSTGLNQWAITVSTSAFFNRIGHYRKSTDLEGLAMVYGRQPARSNNGLSVIAATPSSCLDDQEFG